jgi:integrase
MGLPSTAEQEHVVHEVQRIQATSAARLCSLPAPYETTSRPDPDQVHRALDKALRHAGLGAVCLHDLRRTRASMLLQLGEHPKVIQERLDRPTFR